MSVTRRGLLATGAGLVAAAAAGCHRSRPTAASSRLARTDRDAIAATVAAEDRLIAAYAALNATEAAGAATVAWSAAQAQHERHAVELRRLLDPTVTTASAAPAPAPAPLPPHQLRALVTGAAAQLQQTAASLRDGTAAATVASVAAAHLAPPPVTFARTWWGGAGSS